MHLLVFSIALFTFSGLHRIPQMREDKCKLLPDKLNDGKEERTEMKRNGKYLLIDLFIDLNIYAFAVVVMFFSFVVSLFFRCCLFSATSMHFFFLAAFFWLNAMAFNIYWTFR